jgi:hypothetical protein
LGHTSSVDFVVGWPYGVEAQTQYKEGNMTEETKRTALSDTEILAITDKHLQRDLAERGGTHAMRRLMSDRELALVGQGVVRRDLPYLSSVKKYEEPPEETEDVLEAKRSGRVYPRIHFKSKAYPRISPQYFGLCMAGYEEKARDEFVEVHYGTGEQSVIVIMRNDKVILTTTGNVPSPWPL